MFDNHQGLRFEAEVCLGQDRCRAPQAGDPAEIDRGFLEDPSFMAGLPLNPHQSSKLGVSIATFDYGRLSGNTIDEGM